MNAKNPTFWISACVVALLAEPGVTQAQTRADSDVVTAISNLENDAVKADLAGDAAFYQKFLAEDWTRGDSDGTFYTKTQIVDLLADPKNFKTNSEKLSELKVHVYGNAAVATYKDTYDIMIMDTEKKTFVLVHGAWHGGWCYRHTAAALRKVGNEVFTPTHTGVGERAHKADENITLETHIRDVR